MLWHVMKLYEVAGLNDFVICCGYKGHLIKNYFVNYFMENYDITVNLAKNSVEFHGHPSEQWMVTLVDTGVETMTGGRVRRVASHVAGETFCLTYGDGVGDVAEFQLGVTEEGGLPPKSWSSRNGSRL